MTYLVEIYCPNYRKMVALGRVYNRLQEARVLCEYFNLPFSMKGYNYIASLVEVSRSV